jgi:nicotinic acid phosphoribosyltransferase
MSNPTKPLFQTDAYKLDHRRQYPEGTEFVYSNYTNRGSRLKDIDRVVNFGLQAFLQEWAIDGWKEFFAADEKDVEQEWLAKVTAILGPNSIGSDHIVALHRKGYLPLEFRQVPEGTLVPLRVPSFTIENTEPEFFWLVNYVETIVSNSVWQAQTSATLAHHMRQLLNKWAIKTTDSTDGVQFQMHDFSARGMSSDKSAQYSGAGHLLSSHGTDTLTAIDWVNEFYPGSAFVGGSVAATEHSVMCAGGSDEGEEQNTFMRLLDLYPSGIVSVVSDTWNLWDVLTFILPNLKDQILARDGKLVIRPDSGDPVDIICGKEVQRDLPADKGVIELLWEVFGGTVNEQGFKVLDPHIGAIYGDSITYDRADEISRRLAAKGLASTNVVFGVGSYTYQYNTRDTFGSAIKATWVQINGEQKAIWKDPATDSGLKKSARGRLVVVSNRHGQLQLIDNLTLSQQEQYRKHNADHLKPIWRDGEFLYKEDFDTIRARLEEQN